MNATNLIRLTKDNAELIEALKAKHPFLTFASAAQIANVAIAYGLAHVPSAMKKSADALNPMKGK